MERRKTIWLFCSLFVLGAVFWFGPTTSRQGETASPDVWLLKVNGAIDAVTARFISRGIRKAEKEQASLVVIHLDTPGGRLDSTRAIVQTLLGARVPVAVYVSLSGARAGSAGTFITAAANFAVMAPATNIGAATPVSGTGEDLGKTLATKATNDAAALIRSAAAERGRNADKLEETVRKAASFTATEAVELRVVDFIARDLDDLLAQLNGKSTRTAAGTVTLDTASVAKHHFGMSIPERIVSLIAEPNVVALLLTVGLMAIFVELLSPGISVAGVVGILALVLAFIALGSVPFNWAGVALIIVAAIFIGAEIFTGSGFLGIAAVISFILGALLLFPSDIPSLPDAPVRKISLWLLFTLSGLMAAFTLLVVTGAVKSRRLSYTDPISRLVGQTGLVTSDLSPVGTVQVSGELWSASAEGQEVIRAGEPVTIIGLEGLTLRVRRPDGSP